MTFNTGKNISLDQNLTDARLRAAWGGCQDALPETVRIVVFENAPGGRFIADIIEGPRRYMLQSFNRCRAGWANVGYTVCIEISVG